MLGIIKARGVRDKNIILSLDLLKAAVSKRIPTIILKLFSSNISSQLTKLFNLFFSAGVQKNQNSDVLIIIVFLYFLILTKFLKELCIITSMNSCNPKILFNLRFWFQHSTFHALTHLTDKQRDQPGKRNFSCVIFADF